MRLSNHRLSSVRRSRAAHSWILAVVLLFGAGGFPAAPVAGFYALDDPEVFEAIEVALAEGNAEGVLAFTGRQVTLSILGRGTLYSKGQAVYVLRAFFEDYPPSRFQFSEHKTIDDRLFGFGTYSVRGDDEAFDVSVSLRLRDERWELRELRVEAP